MPVCMEASTHAGVKVHISQAQDEVAPRLGWIRGEGPESLISQCDYSTPYLPTQHSVVTTIWLLALGTLHYTCTRLGGGGAVMSLCRSTRLGPGCAPLTKKDPETPDCMWRAAR